jgi:hypothetical protein
MKQELLDGVSRILESPVIAWILSIVLASALLFQCTRPPKVETKIETQVEYRDREVVKVVEKEVVKWREKLITEIRADGSRSTTEEREGSTVTDSSKLAERTTLLKEKVKAVKTVNPLKNYSVTGFALLDKKLTRVYGVETAARLGNLPLFVTFFVTNTPQLGAGVRLEF